MIVVFGLINALSLRKGGHLEFTLSGLTFFGSVVSQGKDSDDDDNEDGGRMIPGIGNRERGNWPNWILPAHSQRGG